MRSGSLTEPKGLFAPQLYSTLFLAEAKTKKAMALVACVDSPNSIYEQ